MVPGQALTETAAPAADRNLGFSVSARSVRGRVVRLDAALNAVLAAHAYPPVLARLLGEALVLTALLGGMLRDGTRDPGGPLTLQAQARGGAVDLLVADYRAGALRGYLRFDRDVPLSEGMTLPELFGTGHLAITLDSTGGDANDRIQGIVPLEGDTLSDAVAGFFETSEQLPTLVRVHVGGSAAAGWIGGGLLVQHLARGEIGGPRLGVSGEVVPHPDWEHIVALAGTVSPAELTDAALSPETLLWRLFHEETVRVAEGAVPVRGCRCSAAYIASRLSQFPEAERAAMRGPDGKVHVDCEFCARTFAVEV